MNSLTVKHGERRCAGVLDVVIYPPVPADGEPQASPLKLAVLRGAQEIVCGPIEGRAVLSLAAVEPSADAEVTADIPCVVVNSGAALVVLESLGGRYAGVRYPIEPGEQILLALSVFDPAERFAVNFAAPIEPGAPVAPCDRRPCDRSPEGLCARCDIPRDPAAAALDQVPQ